MVINNYTLLHIANSLGLIAGAEITGCFTQEKDVLMISLDDSREEYFLQFGAGSRYCSLFMKSGFRRARANSIDLLPELESETVQDIILLPGNRIIRMRLVNSIAYFLLYGSSKTNLIITDKENKIINSFKSAGELKGSQFSEPESRLKDFSLFGNDVSVMEALSKSSLMLGKYYAAELIRRMGINPGALPGDFTDGEKSKILERANEFIGELKNTQEYYILEAENKNAILSLAKLGNYPEIIETHTDINKAVERRIVYSIKHDGFYRSYSQATERLKGQIRKLRANIEMYSDSSDALEREKLYRHYAEALAAQPNSKEKAGSSAELDYWDGSRLVIPLDPKLTIMQNSGRYFDKARKTKESVVHRKKLLPGMQKQLHEAEAKLAELESAHSVKDLENIGNKGNKMQDRNEAASKFKVFELAGGYTLYVGKSAANNDELTMKFARPNDLWFHARGSSGSHCVLRSAKDEKAPKEIIRKAAEIAAYYSKSKNAKYTPVCYTFKKYVRKPKGADTGSVTRSEERRVGKECRARGGADH